MERLERAPFQGILNIIRFNWHYYVLAAVAVAAWLFFSKQLSHSLSIAGACAVACIVTGTLVSLCISYYVYDRSGLYTLRWMDDLQVKQGAHIVNIHAGFDETSALLAKKYQASRITALDFYDPEKHTEVSIKRARKAYPSFPGTVSISTNVVPMEHRSADCICLLLAAHEIRNQQERSRFFKCLGEVLADQGRIIVLEHQRDFYNFMAYNIGFFHFMPEQQWNKTFADAHLAIESRFNVTPFITGYILKKHGTAS